MTHDPRNWVFIRSEVIDLIHDEQLATHGGLSGVRDPGLLSSALSRPENLANYEDPDVADLAASYAFGICRNHPFLDGNKRTAFLAAVLFLDLNGAVLTAADDECIRSMLRLASGEMTEVEFAAWIRLNLKSGD